MRRGLNGYSDYMFIVAIFLTFILSIISYQYIEKPFRNKEAYPRQIIFQFSVVSISAFLIIGLLGHYLKGFENRFEENIYLETVQSSPKRKECHTKGNDYLKPEKACKYFDNNITWASFGDSHTVEPAYALANLLQANGHGLIHLSFSGCPPALLFDVKQPGCSKWVNESLSYLENNTSIQNVLLGFRYSAFLYGDQLELYPDLPNRDPITQFTESFRKQETKSSREIYWESFSKIVSRLLASGKTIYLLYPIPELPIHITKAITPFSIFGNKMMLDLEKTTSSEYYFSRNNFIINKLDTLPYGDNLHAIKPYDIMCSSEYCPAVNNGKALYFDDDHLSVVGSKKLIAGSIIPHKLKLTKASTRTAKSGATFATLQPHHF